MQEIAIFICDCCGEDNSLAVYPSAGDSQEFVVDCAICCRPNVIRVEFDPDGEAHVQATREED